MRRVLPALLAGLASLLELVGAAGVAHLIVLLAVPAAAVAVLDIVSDRVEGHAGIPEVALAVLGLGFVLAAGAFRAPLLALGVLIAVLPRPLAHPERAHRGSELAAWRARSISG